MDPDDRFIFPLVGTGILDGLEPDAAEALVLLGELRSLTKWDTSTLVSHLGCRSTPRPASPYTAVQLMRHSVALLGWMVALCDLVDREEDRRDVVHGAIELCVAAGGPLEERVARCREAFEAADGRALSARELLKLGEVPAAFRQAGLALPEEPARARNELSWQLSAPLTETIGSHINPRRLKWLFDDAETRNARLGSNVALRMDEHWRDCTLCALTAQELGLPIAPSLTRAHAA